MEGVQDDLVLRVEGAEDRPGLRPARLLPAAGGCCDAVVAVRDVVPLVAQLSGQSRRLGGAGLPHRLCNAAGVGEGQEGRLRDDPRGQLGDHRVGRVDTVRRARSASAPDGSGGPGRPRGRAARPRGRARARRRSLPRSHWRSRRCARGRGRSAGRRRGPARERGSTRRCRAVAATPWPAPTRRQRRRAAPAGRGGRSSRAGSCRGFSARIARRSASVRTSWRGLTTRAAHSAVTMCAVTAPTSGRVTVVARAVQPVIERCGRSRA